ERVRHRGRRADHSHAQGRRGNRSRSASPPQGAPGEARQYALPEGTRWPAGRGAREGQHDATHPGGGACVLHALRDPSRARGRVRSLSRAGVLLTDRWKGYFDSQYLREYEPLFNPIRDRREVARMIDVLQLPVGARVLDCPCGQGRHAHLLAEAGYDVDGLDYSRELLGHAKRRGTGPNLRYTRGDMRALPGKWKGKFDAVVNLFTSFGFFTDPKDDERVIAE